MADIHQYDGFDNGLETSSNKQITCDIKRILFIGLKKIHQ